MWQVCDLVTVRRQGRGLDTRGNRGILREKCFNQIEFTKVTVRLHGYFIKSWATKVLLNKY